VSTKPGAQPKGGGGKGVGAQLCLAHRGWWRGSGGSVFPSPQEAVAREWESCYPQPTGGGGEGVGVQLSPAHTGGGDLHEAP